MSSDAACTYLPVMAKDKGCITEGKYLHMRCMMHIVNWVVQDSIKLCGELVDKLWAIAKYIGSSPSKMNAFKLLGEKWKVVSHKSLKFGANEDSALKLIWRRRVTSNGHF